MNKREAKRIASSLTARLIQQYRDAGQPHQDYYETKKPVEDANKLGSALDDIMFEMQRRSGQ